MTTSETVQVAPPVTPAGQKLTEQERDQMEIRYLRVVNAQQAYDLANVAVQERDRARRDASTDLIALRTQLEIKYKTKLAPGTNLMPDGTIVPSPAPRAVRPLTPADFPQPASETPFPEPAP